MTSVRAKASRKTEYRDLENPICDLAIMANLASLAVDHGCADMVQLAVRLLDEMSADLRRLYEAGFGEGGPCA